MKFRVGDKVKYLNSVGGGRITKIVDKNSALVLNEDGFEEPTLITELIKIDEDELIQGGSSQAEYKDLFKKAPTSGFQQQESLSNEEADHDDFVVYLAFVPQNIDEPENSDIDVYLVNDSNFNTYYNYIVPHENLYQNKSNGFMEANTKIYVETIYRYAINKYNGCVVQLLPSLNGYHEPVRPVHKEIQVSPVRLCKRKSFVVNDFFEEDSVLFTVIKGGDPFEMEIENLTEQHINKVIQQKEEKSKKINTPKQYRSSRPDEEEVVDLHIHELIEDEEDLKPKELLEIQMKHFHEGMKKAIDKRMKRIVFIHGVGNGTLKHEVRRELDRVYKKYQYQDASFAEYGWGATMVLLR